MGKSYFFMGSTGAPSKAKYRGKKRQTVLTVGQVKQKKTMPKNYK